MVAATKWAAASTARTAIDLGTTLAADTLSAVGSEIDNSTNLDMYGWLELTTSTGNLYSSAVTRQGSAAEIYMITAPDGTNYDNAPATADRYEFGHLMVATIPIPTEAGNELATVGPILLPPHKFKFYLANQCDQQMAATWELNLYTNNIESQ